LKISSSDFQVSSSLNAHVNGSGYVPQPGGAQHTVSCVAAGSECDSCSAASLRLSSAIAALEVTEEQARKCA